MAKTAPKIEIEYHFPPRYTPYTPPTWPENFPIPASMLVPAQGMSFPVTSRNAKVPHNCVVFPFKTWMLSLGELAKPSEGNLIKETKSKT